MASFLFLLKKIKKNPDIFFFSLFLLSFPFSIRKIIFQVDPTSPFNEYSSISIYLSDLLLFLTIASWVFVLCNKKYKMSNVPRGTLSFSLCYPKVIHIFSFFSFLKKYFSSNKMFHVEHFIKKTRDLLKKISASWHVSLPLLLLLWSFLSFFWSEEKFIALFRSFNLFKFTILYFFVLFKIKPFLKYLHFPCFTPIKLFHVEQFAKQRSIALYLFPFIVILAFFNSLTAIAQFILQSSIGLRSLGESVLSPSLPGVAKIILNGDLYIRAYGFFPHPNILAGFLVFSLILSYFYYKSTMQLNCSTWNNLIKFFIFIQLIALLLTFSKSAIIGLFLTFLVFLIKSSKCSTWNILKPAGLFIYLKNVPRGTFLSLFLILLFFIFLYFNLDLQSFLIKSIRERAFYLPVLYDIIITKPFLGAGSGQFTFYLSVFYENVSYWQIQPIHNVFLLILAELGLIGFFLFSFFIYKLLLSKKIPIDNSKKCSTWNIYQRNITIIEANQEEHTNASSARLEKNTLQIEDFIYLILLVFIFISLFDHYFWTIQQGSILFWLTLGLLAGKYPKY